jgi:hypothetical protein
MTNATTTSAGAATPIFDALITEVGLQWPEPSCDDEGAAIPPEPQVTTGR